MCKRHLEHTLSSCCRSATNMLDLTSAAIGTSVAVPTMQSIELAFVTDDTIDGVQADTFASYSLWSSTVYVCMYLHTIAQPRFTKPAQALIELHC